jgi:xanthine dehydrogenase small subunit
MAATTKRAMAVERQLIGSALHDSRTWRMAAEHVAADFNPLTDLRASSQYRLSVARNIVIKALAEIAGVSSRMTRVVDRRENPHAAN